MATIKRSQGDIFGLESFPSILLHELDGGLENCTGFQLNEYLERVELSSTEQVLLSLFLEDVGEEVLINKVSHVSGY
jgi:hypothetical protein